MPNDSRFKGYDLAYQRMLNQEPDWAAAEREKYAFACTKPWLPADRDVRILDFGCGWGHQLLSLWCAGYRNIEGIEISREQAQTAKRCSGGRCQIHCKDGRDFISEKQGDYDLIIINDVIEHMPAPDAITLLNSMRHALAPHGTVVLKTVNMSSLLAPFSLCLDITHVQGYTEFSIQQLLDQAGFRNHQFVPECLGWTPRQWRPWKPWSGLGIRKGADRLMHLILYWLRGQKPSPRLFGYNLEVYSQKASDGTT